MDVPAAPSPFHAGEHAVQTRLGVRDRIEPWARGAVRPALPPQHREFYEQLPFLVAAARDERGRPWATLLTGRPGFARAPDPRRLEIDARPVPGDALHGALPPGADLGLLGIELHTRRRNRVNGRVQPTANGGLALAVDQSFGNCPQYITERQWQWVEPPRPPAPPRHHARLSAEHTAWIRGADTLFIATGHRGPGHDARFGMDASHRGGSPGFIGVPDDRTLLIPDYAGNNFFNTIGNLVVDPRAGLLLVDMGTGGMLQLTGRTEIDWDSPRVALFSGARRLIVFTLDEAIELPQALPLRWSEARGSIRSLRLVHRTRESDDVTSFVFEARDGGPLPGFAAGQHLSIELSLPDHTEPVSRTYSLSSGPSTARYRITVKREPHGLASRFLHDQLPPEAIVSAQAPAGDFVLDHGSRPVVLVSAGVGITPMVSMLHALAADASPRPVWFIHGARDGAHHPLREEVQRLASDRPDTHVHVAYSRPRPEDRRGPGFDAVGRIDAALVARLVPSLDVEVYLCGPISFMAALTTGLEALGMDPERIHAESFGPAPGLVLEQQYD